MTFSGRMRVNDLAEVKDEVRFEISGRPSINCNGIEKVNVSPKRKWTDNCPKEDLSAAGKKEKYN